MPEYPKCPNGHLFADEAEAIRIQPRSANDLKLVSGWVLLYCRGCGHIYSITPPTDALISQYGL